MLHLKHRLLYALRAAVPLHLPFHHRLRHTAGRIPRRRLPRRQLRHNASASQEGIQVRSFLFSIGLTEADVAAAVVSFPNLLYHKVDETLTPRVPQLREIGLSPLQISRLITVAPEILASPVKVSRLAFYISFLGSYDRVHSALKKCYYLLRQDLQTVVKPNIAFLRQCGLSNDDIGQHCLLRSRILLAEPQRLKEIAVCADELGVSRNSVAFKQALLTIYGINAGRLNVKLSFLKNVIGCSEAELGNLVSKAPKILEYSESKLGRTMEFLKMEVGLEPSYVLNRPALFNYSIERRLMPRHYVIRMLKAKGLLSKEIDFYNVVCKTEEKFLEKFVLPYNKSFPGLMDAYASACRGQVTLKL